MTGMARVTPIPVREWPPEMRSALEALVPPGATRDTPLGSTGPTPLNALGILAHHPTLARAFCTLNGHVLMTSSLDDRQREIIVLRVAAVRHCAYLWTQHLSIAREAGLNDDEIGRIAFGSDAPFWNVHEAALLRAVDELTLDGAIAGPTWNTLAEVFDAMQLLDVIFAASGYDAFSRMLLSFDVELDHEMNSLA